MRFSLATIRGGGANIVLWEQLLILLYGYIPTSRTEAYDINLTPLDHWHPNHFFSHLSAMSHSGGSRLSPCESVVGKIVPNGIVRQQYVHLHIGIGRIPRSTLLPGLPPTGPKFRQLRLPINIFRVEGMSISGFG